MRTCLLSVFLALIVGIAFAAVAATPGVCTATSSAVIAAIEKPAPLTSPVALTGEYKEVVLFSAKIDAVAGACASPFAADLTSGIVIVAKDVDAAPGLLTLKFPLGTVTPATSTGGIGAARTESPPVPIVLGAASFTPQSAVLVT